MKSKYVDKYENVIIRNNQEIGISDYGLDYMVGLEQKLQQKENIIKEVREFIYKCNDGKQGINYSGCSKLLEILDKENK